MGKEEIALRLTLKAMECGLATNVSNYESKANSDTAAKRNTYFATENSKSVHHDP